MECPKCHKKISDTSTICPFCHKVLALTCPNCHAINHSAVCTKCGYIILEKCSKCGKLTPTNHKTCKCGFSTATSVAFNECDSDEFASITIKFNALPKIRSLLKSHELYAKFLNKLKNLITAQLKDIDVHVIVYGDTYTINFNKELSFATSVNKAIRFSLKLVTAFSGLNLKLIDQFGTPLKLTLTIMKKNAEELLVNKSVTSNVKLMIAKSHVKKYLRGMQIIIDQYCQDNTNEYKTDSLYSLELDGASVMFYEVLLDEYIIPPSENTDVPADLSAVKSVKINKSQQWKNDKYAFNVFDINAKCQFEKCSAVNVPSQLDFSKKILAIKSEPELNINTREIINKCREAGLRPIYIACTEEMNYKPWGFFEKLFKSYYNLPGANGLIDQSFNAGTFNEFKQFILGNIPNASSAEDARFAFLEQFMEFVSTIKNCVIIVDSFENIDDTSLQALELYFNKFLKVLVNFIFITNNQTPVHSKIKGLLQTTFYKEITVLPCSIDDILSDIKDDASDFINSFHFERMKDCYNGSKLYFDNAIRYLIDRDVLVCFEKKLLIKSNRSCMLPKDLMSLIRARLKSYGKYKDASMILAYSVFLGERLDFTTLEMLGISNVEDNSAFLDSTGFTFTDNNVIYINNYSYVRQIIQASLKPEIQEVLAKNILAKLGKVLDNTSLLLLMGALSMYKEEYMLLWKNTRISICAGDYDAYLKNCLGYLSLIDKMCEDIPQENIENNKKEIFQNILMSLYAYSPAKIYSIENVLLMDAIQAGDDDKIVKLSNLMLQGALITANYTEAATLLHNILVRMPNPSLIVDGSVNTRFLLLSLVNIEILFNIGDYRSCIELAEELLQIITPNIISEIKPANFSVNLFVTHLMDTFRLVVFAKLLANDSDIEEFCSLVNSALDAELPDRECIFAVKEFLAGKSFMPSNTENTTPFSKIIYLILNELSLLKDNYKEFAQNIYQAKLLAEDLNQKQLVYICDILIGYAYSQVGIQVKADAILEDVLKISENSAMFNIILFTRYIMIKNKLKYGDIDAAILLINDTLADIQKRDNQAQVFYAMYERLFIEVAMMQHLKTPNLQIEVHKLLQVSPNGELERIIRRSDFESILKTEPDEREAFVSDEDPVPHNSDEEYNEEEYSDQDEEYDDLADVAESFANSDSLGTETHP